MSLSPKFTEALINSMVFRVLGRGSVRGGLRGQQSDCVYAAAGLRGLRKSTTSAAMLRSFGQNPFRSPAEP